MPLADPSFGFHEISISFDFCTAMQRSSTWRSLSRKPFRLFCIGFVLFSVMLSALIYFIRSFADPSRPSRAQLRDQSDLLDDTLHETQHIHQPLLSAPNQPQIQSSELKPLDFVSTAGLLIPITQRLNHDSKFSIAVHPTFDKVSHHIRVFGTWEKELLASMLRELPPVNHDMTQPRRLFVDVGANIGWFSMNVAAHGHRVVSVEPFPRNLALLHRSTALLHRARGPIKTKSFIDDALTDTIVPNITIPRVRIYEFAAGERGGADMCLFHQGANNLGNGRLVPAFEGVKDFVDAHAVTCESKVRTARLDDILRAEFQHSREEQRVWGLKIDVEGFEAMVLRGMDSFFKDPKRRPCHIWFEFARDWVVATGATATEIFELLDATGYLMFKETMSDSNVEAHSMDPACQYQPKPGLPEWTAFKQDRITWKPSKHGWPGPGLSQWKQ